MINQVFSLVQPKQIISTFELIDEIGDNDLLVRPSYLSICQADKRYFYGLRDEKILKEKLPMALIHEAVGVVVKSGLKSKFKCGDHVVMIPNHPTSVIPGIRENYNKEAKFRSSSMNGFMQENILIKDSEVVLIMEKTNTLEAVLSELLSVVIHAVDKVGIDSTCKKIGIWGDGNLSYLLSLYVKYTFPDIEIVLFGKHQSKMDMFTNVSKAVFASEHNEDNFDICVEAVGGNHTKAVVDDIISCIRPEGKILLLGVSENPPQINTRMVLEKGLTLQGASRSGKEDFQKAIDFIESDSKVLMALQMLISNTKDIHEIKDIVTSFEEESMLSWGKYVMKWKI